MKRLMRQEHLAGAVRGKVKITTVADPTVPQRARDLVRRDFTPTPPDRLWVADLTYVSTWSGWVYVAFVTDAYARRAIGWRCGTMMSTQLVLDASSKPSGPGNATVGRWTPLSQPPVEPRRYTAIRYAERLAEAGIAASVGSVGSS